jgi:hypothetical protein
MHSEVLPYLFNNTPGGEKSALTERAGPHKNGLKTEQSVRSPAAGERLVAGLDFVPVKPPTHTRPVEQEKKARVVGVVIEPSRKINSLG